MAIQQFELLKKSAVTEIQADLEAAVLADRLLAESARDAAQLAKTAAETAETNAELAETNAELAETNAEAAKDLAVAAANAFPATNPQVAYHSRVLADSGVIKDLEELTKHYLEVLQIKETAEIIWSGEAGYKLTDTKYSKVYNMATNAYDLTATVGNEFQSSGSIAPNELMRVNGLTGETGTKDLIGTTKQYTAAQAFTAIITLKPNKLSATATRIYTSASNYFLLTSTAITYVGDTGNVLTATYSLAIGKFSIIELQYNNGAGLIKVNNVPITTTASSMATTFGRLQLDQTTYNFDGSIAAFELYSGRLSESASSANYTYNRVLHPEIEGIDIGNQHWATSNYEGVVAGDGSVIGEYKYTAANSPNIIVNGDMELATGGLANNWMPNVGGGAQTNTIVTGNGFTGNAQRCQATSTATYAGIIQNGKVVNGKVYKVSFKYRTNSTTLRFNLGGTDTIGLPANELDAITYTSGWIKSASDLFIVYLNNEDSTKYFEVDDIVVKEAGWDEAQELYDGVYAQTTGTAAVKDLAATKAASMWCYYNNDALNGAIYGKLYNWWAVKLISLYPPAGWRVPSYADFFQLRDYSGGQSIAGKKLKIIYGNNSVGTNETGFSMLGTTSRSSNGEFTTDDANYNKLWLSTDSGLTTANHSITYSYWSELYIDPSLDKRAGCALRLLRNEPVGEDTKIISTGRFATDISSGVSTKSIHLSFGYAVSSIVIKCTTALTNIEAKLYDYNMVEKDTLITGKSLNSANKTFIVTADQTELLQDGYVVFTATGNSGDGMTIDVVLKKIQ